jgi:hypothetical protein
VARNATEKIDNLDRMELTLISKIKNYRKKYSKDPRILFFDFPRATEIKQIVASICFMEDYGRREVFGKEIDIPDIFSNTAPDLSFLSEYKWRLGGSTKQINL